MISRPADPSPHDTLSPSLRRNGERVPSFELKFLLPEARARELEALLGPLLALDPHGNPALGGAYRTATLYLDTPELTVLRATDGRRRRKHRARRYGAGDVIFLERKVKVGDRVRKKRACIPLADLALLNGAGLTEDSPAAWFQQKVASGNLRPQSLVWYERIAYCGVLSGSPVRLTFDRDVRGLPINEWRLSRDAEAAPPLLADVICELKFAWSMPQAFKRAIETLQLTPVRLSKYRLAMQRAGIATEGPPDARVA